VFSLAVEIRAVRPATATSEGMDDPAQNTAIIHPFHATNVDGKAARSEPEWLTNDCRRRRFKGRPRKAAPDGFSVSGPRLEKPTDAAD
jgi:hypothetical protein